MATTPAKYPQQLIKEAQETEKLRAEMLAKMQQKLDSMKFWVETMQTTFETTDCRLTPKERERAIKNCMEEVKTETKSLNEQMKLLRDRMKRAPEFEFQKYKLEAEQWFAKANKVLTTSGKNKLYLGNREYVTDHAKGSPKKPEKEERYLNAGVWSWGVNLAWIEGGIAAKATFKIKFHASDQFKGFPDGSLNDISDNPYMSSEEWVALCRKYPGSLLWHSSENRPTWFALEVEAALSAGYHFAVRDTKSGDTKLTLEC